MTYGLRVWCRLPVDLVARQNDHVGLFVIQNLSHKLQCSAVRVACSAIVTFRLRIPANANTGAEVEIRDLKNLEFAVPFNPRYRLVDLVRRTTPEAQTSFLRFARSIQQEGRVSDFPTRAGLNSIGAKQDIHCGHNLIGVAVVPLAGSQKPNPCRSVFPLCRFLALLAHGRVESSDAYIDDDSFIRLELLLAFALNMDVGLVEPSGA